MYIYFDFDFLVVWSISLSFCEVVRFSEDILFVDLVMKLFNDSVKFLFNVLSFRLVEGENIGFVLLVNFRFVFCIEYRFFDDIDRCKVWLLLREGWDIEK